MPPEPGLPPCSSGAPRLCSITTPDIRPAPRLAGATPSAWALQEFQEYARELRPLLPPEAFRTNPDRLALVLINLVILGLGWGLVAPQLERWSWPWLPLFLPFALVMANSVIVLLFASHDLLHGNGLRQRGWRRWVGLVGLAALWMPPTLWQAVHNREHHGHTNAHSDPDRSYLEHQSRSWGSWIQHQFVPSNKVRPLGLLIGIGGSWFVHNLRTLLSVLQVGGSRTAAPAPFSVSALERRRILVELALIASAHGAIVVSIGWAPLPLLLGYLLPLWLGYAGAMAYIFTNHFLSPLGEVNDPLHNTLSLQVPRWLDALHLNFSHHVEHHIFPGLNTDYYPMVRRLLLERYGHRYQQLPITKAWRLLMGTPRLYRDATTLVDQAGLDPVRVPLARR